MVLGSFFSAKWVHAAIEYYGTAVLDMCGQRMDAESASIFRNFFFFALPSSFRLSVIRHTSYACLLNRVPYHVIRVLCIYVLFSCVSCRADMVSVCTYLGISRRVWLARAVSSTLSARITALRTTRIEWLEIWVSVFHCLLLLLLLLFLFCHAAAIIPEPFDRASLWSWYCALFATYNS